MNAEGVHRAVHHKHNFFRRRCRSSRRRRRESASADPTIDHFMRSLGGRGVYLYAVPPSTVGAHFFRYAVACGAGTGAAVFPALRRPRTPFLAQFHFLSHTRWDP